MYQANGNNKKAIVATLISELKRESSIRNKEESVYMLKAKIHKNICYKFLIICISYNQII